MSNTDGAIVLEGAIVKGDVTIGEKSSVWYNAVIRGDMNSIRIGEKTNIQDCAVLHVDANNSLNVGNGVTVGHRAILHGCTVGDNTLIGMGSIVMNGCHIGKDSIVAAGSLVPQNKTFPDGVLLMGSPARVRRSLTKEEIEGNRSSAVRYAELAERHIREF